MHAYATLAMLALAGSALAAPHRGHAHIVYETAVVTVVVGPNGQPIGGAAPTPAPQPQPEPHPAPAPAPAKPTPVVVEQQAPAPSPKPAPAPSPESAPSNPSSGYMGVVNAWRQKLGLPSLTQDPTLEKNALKTCADGNGEMHHELNPGTMGQVLAPGQPGDFEKVFVGGWLCEKPNMPGMNGVCAKMSSGWAYSSTGHADILSNKGYKKIGCANAKGIWGCDVA